MIPPFSISGVLPPFAGADPTNPAEQSPYRISMQDVVDRFAHSLERIEILEGFFAYREKMRSLNVLGYQWLDGSFVEDCEKTRGRPPADIDVITFAYRPKDANGNYLGNDEFYLISEQNSDLFDSEVAKASYHCDAYYVDFHQHPHALAQVVTYWCNLFSHSRINNVWKGILEVQLNVDDSQAVALLQSKKNTILATGVGGDNA